MSQPVEALPTTGLERVLARADGRSRLVGALVVALLGHAALVALALEQRPALPPLVVVTEVELLRPSAPEPAPPPAPPPAAQPPAPAAPSSAPAPTRARRTATSPPASAAKLRTIDEAVPTTEAPVRFVTDPSGAAFGFGSVARGGTAASASGAVAPEALPAPSRPTGGSGAPSLSRAPVLGESDPCRGFFPGRARVDRGEVALRVRVERDGAVRKIEVVREAPSGHGFGEAARTCLLSKHFTPALDRAGAEVAVVSPVTVRFSR